VPPRRAGGVQLECIETHLKGEFGGAGVVSVGAALRIVDAAIIQMAKPLGALAVLARTKANEPAGRNLTEVDGV